MKNLFPLSILIYILVFECSVLSLNMQKINEGKEQVLFYLDNLEEIKLSGELFVDFNNEELLSYQIGDKVWSRRNGHRIAVFHELNSVYKRISIDDILNIEIKLQLLLHKKLLFEMPSAPLPPRQVKAVKIIIF